MDGVGLGCFSFRVNARAPLVEAALSTVLENRGHRPVGESEPADLLLIDCRLACDEPGRLDGTADSIVLLATYGVPGEICRCWTLHGPPKGVLSALEEGGRIARLAELVVWEDFFVASRGFRGAVSQQSQHSLPHDVRQVLRLLARGWRVPDVAAELSYSERTIQRRLAVLRSSLGVRTNVELVSWAIDAGQLQR